MATARSRTNSASSNSCVASDNSDIHVRGAKNVLEQGSRNKNMIQRTRDALGDIGNRLKKNGGNANNGNAKPGFAIGKPALGLQNTGNFAMPLAPAPKAARQDVNAAKKLQVIRSNSAAGGDVSQHTAQPIPQKPKLVKAKVFTNLHRSQSLHVKNEHGESKENVPAQIKESVREEGENETPKEMRNSQTSDGGAVTEEIKYIEANSHKAVDPSVVVDGGSQLSNDPNEKTDGEPKGDEGDTEDVLQIDQIEKGFSSKRFGVIDIDANDEDNYFLVTQYINDICDYLFALEKKYPIKIRYLEGRLVNSRMRAVLMDWLVEVHNQFKFAPETLYIATKTMDRYLQIDRSITRKQLQLVGVTAMYVAAKFEEVCTPTVLDFAAVSDNAFSSSEVLKMEENMLRTLGYDLAPPPSCFFLRRFSKAASSSIQLHGLAKYIMELALVDYAAAHLFPSEQAAGALSLAMLVLEKKPLAQLWNCTMQHYSKTTLQSLTPVITIMCGVLSRAHEEPTKLQAVTNKYARARAFRVSKMPELHIDQWKGRVAKELILYKQ